MKKTLLLILGKSGSGKSTLEQKLVTLFPNDFNKIVSLTTRPIRDGETHRVDYRFVSEELYDQLLQEGKFRQITSFANYRYGSLKEDYETTHKYSILVVTPGSAATLKSLLENTNSDITVKILLFDISNYQLVINMKKRGGTVEWIRERLSKDTLDADFIKSRLVADFRVTDDIFNEDLSDKVLEWLDKI